MLLASIVLALFLSEKPVPAFLEMTLSDDDGGGAGNRFVAVVSCLDVLIKKA
jgi:hypothetical protein